MRLNALMSICKYIKTLAVFYTFLLKKQMFLINKNGWWVGLGALGQN